MLLKKRKLTLLLFLLFGLLPSVQAHHMPPLDKEAMIGTMMPRFFLPDPSSKLIDSESLKGKRVVLNIWASWCPPCRREMPALSELHLKLQKQNAMVIGLSADQDLNLAREYLYNTPVTFPIILNGYSYVQHLGVNVYPTTFVIDQYGRIEQIYEGEKDWLNMPELFASQLPPYLLSKSH